jgi:hypothetical protein
LTQPLSSRKFNNYEKRMALVGQRQRDSLEERVAVKVGSPVLLQAVAPHAGFFNGATLVTNGGVYAC